MNRLKILVVNEEKTCYNGEHTEILRKNAGEGGIYCDGLCDERL